MFCSRCGKTLMAGDQQCPHCGTPVGESRFEGTPYTSAQAHISPNAPVRQATAGYTRTTYTTIPEDRQQEGDVDSRTTYRPVYEGGSTSQAIRRDMRETFQEKERETQAKTLDHLSEEALDTLNAVDEELKMEDMDTSELRSRPIESTGRAGISAGVEDYIQKLEASQSRRAARRRKATTPAGDDHAYSTPEEDPVVYDDLKDNSGIDTDQSEVFDDIDEDEFDEMRYGRQLKLQDIVKVAAAMVAAAVVIVGLVMWFRHIRDNTSSAKIEGVTATLYDQGVALIKSHAEQDYINDLISVYNASGATGLATRAESDAQAIDALLPAEPAANDPLFVSALHTIQENIGNAVLMDAMSASAGLADAESASQARWEIVNNSITQLESASTAAELTAILNGSVVTVTAPEPTPTPVPEVVYQTLQKGDKSDAVLEMQNRLYMLGFLQDDRDGAFGNKTQTAVKLFQSAAGLEVTGVADSETLTRLYADDAPLTELAQITPVPASTDAPADQEDIYTGDAEAPVG